MERFIELDYGTPMPCPTCGFDTPTFIDGDCPECAAAKHQALLQHNAQYDYWQGLSDKEREDQIRWSSNHYG